MIDLLAEEFTRHHSELLPVMSLVLALGWFSVCAIALFVIDVRHHRLPNVLTAALAIGATISLLTTTWTASSDSFLAGRGSAR